MTIQKTNVVMSRTIGILGGMGPEATNDLYKKIIEATEAHNDQDHIKTVIISNPKIPDRTEYIARDGPSPLRDLIDGIRKLEYLGADIITIPCNTAHYFYQHLQQNSSVPILNMLEESISYTKKHFPGAQRIGLLATTGTIKSKIYEYYFRKYGLRCTTPSIEYQNIVMNAIYGKNGIKAGDKTHSKKLLEKTIIHLKEQGADLIVLGCTELPLVLHEHDYDIPLIDPVEILAKVTVNNINKGDKRLLIGD